MLLTTGCEKKTSVQDKAGKPTSELAAKKAAAAAPAEKVDTVVAVEEEPQIADGIDGIREVWRDRPIALEDATVNIQTLAKAFCRQYPGFAPNEVLRDHLSGQSNAAENQAYSVNLEPRNGYVSVESTTELPIGTTICYWNKRGGHKLMGVWMERHSEGEKAEKLLLFYDYDPQTKTLKPETKLVDDLQRITGKFGSWSLRLPAEGKDIEIMEFSGEDSSDTFKCTYYTWKWNGASFTFDPNGRE